MFAYGALIVVVIQIDIKGGATKLISPEEVCDERLNEGYRSNIFSVVYHPGEKHPHPELNQAVCPSSPPT